MTGRLVFQFVTERDPVSAAIRWFSHAPVSHVDLVLGDGRLFGAHLSGGVKARAPGYAEWSRIIRVAIETPRAAAVTAAVLSQDGKPYDWRAIAAFAAGRDWRDRGQWICSELQLWGAEQGRLFPRPLTLPANKATPGDCLFLFAAIGEVVYDSAGAP